MGTIYVTEQGAKLGIDHQRLEVRKDGEVLVEFPLGHVEQVVIVGNAAITTPAIKRLMRRGIELTFVGVGGQYYGRIAGKLSPHVTLRRAQYRHQSDPAFTLEMARRIVRGKIRNQKVLLQRRRREGAEELEAVIADLNGYEARAGRARTLNALRGIEGSATGRYFSGLRHLLGPQWHFLRRNRRPPRDPINVMLSLGYTLLTRAAESAVRMVGLDPYVGFLHADAYNRPSLALDVVEEFRVIVDGLILYRCHRGLVTPDDFRAGGPDEPPIVMGREALQAYIGAFERRMRRVSRHPRTGERLPLWRFLEAQAREVVRCVREGRPDYRPAVFR